MTASRFDDVEGRDLDAAIHQRKTLELTVYPRLKPPRSGTEIEAYRKQWRRERKVIESKRLTDAELAAEVWHSIVRFYTTAPGEDACEEARRDGVLERFATLPHFDEAQP